MGYGNETKGEPGISSHVRVDTFLRRVDTFLRSSFVKSAQQDSEQINSRKRARQTSLASIGESDYNETVIIIPHLLLLLLLLQTRYLLTGTS